MEFEEKIRAREVQNARFSFLNRNDPYFMYYKHVLYEFTLYPDRSKAPSRPSFLPHIVKPEKPLAPVNDPKKPKFKSLIECAEPSSGTIADLEPFEFALEQVPLTLADIDTVKITAQFVARNGKSFMLNLTQRESKNYLFDFLKPQHNIYPFFIKLVEQYTKILAPSADMIKTLKIESENRSAVLERVKKRYEWFRKNDTSVGDDKKKEKVRGLVDWHEFVVVETITFREDEMTNLPPPVTLEQLGARIISEERFVGDKDAKIQVEDGDKLQKNGDREERRVEKKEISETIVMDEGPKINEGINGSVANGVDSSKKGNFLFTKIWLILTLNHI